MAREQKQPYIPDREKRQKIMNEEKRRSKHVDIDKEDGTPLKKQKMSLQKEVDSKLKEIVGVPHVTQNRGLTAMKEKKTSDANMKAIAESDIDALFNEIVEEVETQIEKKNTRNNNGNRYVDGYKRGYNQDVRNNEHEIDKVLEELVNILESEN